MSFIPSLTVWSSIKIRPPGYYNKSSSEAKSSVTYAKSWNRMKQKNNFEPVREVVNLRVPSPLRLAKDYTDVLPCMEIHKKRASHRKKTQNIGHVTVPQIQGLDASQNTDWGEGGHKHRHKPCLRPSSKEAFDDELSENLYYDEKFPCCDPDSGYDMEPNCIPTVKPWTSEELRALKKKYGLMEEKTKPSTEKKKTKRKVKMIRSEQISSRKQTRTSCSDTHKSRKSPCSNVSCNDIDSWEPQQCSLPVAKWKQGRQYYETKLAELYLIELGMNR